MVQVAVRPRVPNRVSVVHRLQGRRTEGLGGVGVKKWGQPLIDVTGTDSGAMEAVVSEATRHAKKAGVKRLRAFTNDGSASGALKSCGDVQAEGNPLLARPLTSRILPADIRSLQSWRITSQDSDTF